MRIVTWNCHLKFARKMHLIDTYQPDILIIQECEQLPLDYFPNAQYHWMGHDNNNGLGVVLFGLQGHIESSCNNKLDYFLPINLDNGTRILATWAYNHRAAIRFGEGHYGSAADALDFYSDWLKGTDKAIMSGDFNNSIIWDKGNSRTDFKQINASLESLGFKSSYHQFNAEEFGQESKATLYHTKKEDKPYHIDYVFLKGFKVSKVEMGQYSNWIKASDHMPLITDIAD